MRKHFVIYGHGGSYNHGCEALTGCSIRLLRRVFPNCRVTLSTHFVEQDREFGLPADEFVVRNPSGRTNEEVYASTIDAITPQSVCFHAAGDNYCYRNWQRWALIHYKALERGAKSVLWSCSIDPEVVDAEMLDAFQTHHLIAARESITYDLLIDHGLANVVKISDTAFMLEPEPMDIGLHNFVALNLSPLIMRKNPLVLSAYQELLDYILLHTNMDIALVPHVVQPADNDYDALKLLTVRDSHRVTLVSDKLSAAQYKYIIGKSRFCVAARTHASIAAYSLGVPAMVVGYSVKSRGIAADLGMSEYTIGLGDIGIASDILQVFQLLLENENQVKKRLELRVPSYVQNPDLAKWLAC